jgi:tRNA A37 threonylcarbamoyladenosine dehydratase
MDTNIGLFNRQDGIIRPDELPKHVMIVGAGGIGSWTALAFAKMGAQKITIVDFDDIEDVNVAPQFYRLSDIGKKKGEVLKQRINEEMGKEICEYIDGRWENLAVGMPEYISATDVEVLVMAVDSMDIRIKIFNDIKYVGLSLIIDGRMAKEQLEIFAVKMTDQEAVQYYQKYLYPSSEVEEIACTERAVAYNQFVIAGLIGALLKHYAKGELETKHLLFDLVSFICVEKN